MGDEKKAIVLNEYPGTQILADASLVLDLENTRLGPLAIGKDFFAVAYSGPNTGSCIGFFDKDWKDIAKLHTRSEGHVNSMDVCGEKIAVAFGDGAIHLFEKGNLTRESNHKRASLEMAPISMTLSEKWIAVAFRTYWIQVFGLNGEELLKFEAPDVIRALNTQKGNLFVACKNGYIYGYDINEEIKKSQSADKVDAGDYKIALNAKVHPIALAADDDLLVVGSSTGEVVVFEGGSNNAKELADLGGEEITSVSVDDDIIAAAQEGGLIRLIDKKLLDKGIEPYSVDLKVLEEWHTPKVKLGFGKAIFASWEGKIYSGSLIPSKERMEIAQI